MTNFISILHNNSKIFDIIISFLKTKQLILLSFTNKSIKNYIENKKELFYNVTLSKISNKLSLYNIIKIINLSSGRLKSISLLSNLSTQDTNKSHNKHNKFIAFKH